MKTFVLLTLFLTLLMPSQAQDKTDNIPYLYYFDGAQRAFIIERADDTDRRILGEGLLEAVEGGYLLNGPGWSPDGKWLAYTAIRPFDVQWGRRGFVINVDGETRLKSLPESGESSLRWSPDGRQLFVVNQQFANGIVTVHFEVIDVQVDKRQRLHEFQYAATNAFPAGYSMRWIGESVLVEGSETIQNVRQPVIYIFKDGEFQARIRADNLIPDKDFHYFASSTGWVAQRISGGLELVNLLTREQVTHQIEWDDNYAGAYRMIWNGNEGVLSGENIWFVAPDSILQIIRFNPQLRPVARYFDWSPDGEHLFTIQDQLVFQFSDGLVSQLDLSVQHIFAGFNLTWIDGNSAFLLVDEALYKHDFDTKETQLIAEQIPYATEPAFSVSPSGKLIGYINEGAILYDTVNDTLTRYAPDPYSYFTFSGGYIEWRDEWMLIYENAFQAGSGRPYFLSVIQQSGEKTRAIGRIIRGGPIYAGWLPRNVDASHMPTAPFDEIARLQPDQKFRGDHWSFRIKWSPDGAKLAAGLDWDTGDITIWDVERGLPLETIHDISLDTALRWENGELVLQNLPRQNIDFDSNDSWRIISRDAEGTYVQLYDIQSGEFVCPLVGGDYDVTSSASLSPDGKYLATGHRYEPAKIWDVETCTVVATLPEAAPGVAFSPDGTRLAAGVSWDIHIFNVELLLGKPRIFG